MSKQVMYLIFALLALLLIALVPILFSLPKYCLEDADCVTSCGKSPGRGECHNEKFLFLAKLTDNTNCFTRECVPCVECKCINNTCAVMEYEERECC